MSVKLDQLDLAILSILQTNCKATVTELAKLLGKPRTTIASRLEKLLNSGVIQSFRAILDYKRLGFSLTAFIFLTVRRGEASNQVMLAEQIVESCKKNPSLWIEEVNIITGRYDIMMKIRVKSLEELTHFLIDFLPRFRDVERSETFLVLQTVEEYRPISLQVVK